MVKRQAKWILILVVICAIAAIAYAKFARAKEVTLSLADPELEKKAEKEFSAKPFEKSPPPDKTPAENAFSRIVNFASVKKTRNQESLRISAETSFDRFVQYVNAQGKNLYRLGILRPALLEDNTPAYRVTWLPKGGLFARIGARIGDEITHINNVPVNNRLRLAKEWLFIGSASKIEITARRGGGSVQFLFVNKNDFD